MTIFHDSVAAGMVTRVQYSGPDGAPMAASFYGWHSEIGIIAMLDRFRRLDAKVEKVGK